MGSRRLITVLLVYIFVFNDIRKTEANVGNLKEERHEYQYQRSSKVVGGTGYYNSPSGNYGEASTDLDGWTQNQRDQLQSMTEKLKTELITAQPEQNHQSGYSGSSTNGQGCNKICAFIPGFTGRTQQEIDVIAKDMTAEIIADLKSGKLIRSQLNQPNWFEQQVAQKLIELRKLHQEQYQQNVYRAKLHENQGSQVQPNLYIGGSTYSKDIEDLQQQQQNVFSDDDLRQVQQSVFDQRQHQQQGNFYQQQTQNQHTVYTLPVNRYYNSHTTNRESTNEDKMRTVYPTPIVVTNNVMEEKNYTSSSNTATTPQMNVYNQYGHREEEQEDKQYTQTQVIPTIVPGYDRSYYAQKEYEERQRGGYRPMQYPSTSQTIHTSQTTSSERERTVPVVIPTQRTITNIQVDQEEKEVRRRPQLPQVYNYGREEKTEESETYHRNRQNMVPPTQRTTYDIRNTEQEEKFVEVHTPSPVPVTSSKHNIYNHIEESEVVPNYQPRVVIDKNTEFEVLDHRREYERRPQIPQVTTQTQVTTHELEEEQRRHQYQPQQRPTQTTYMEKHNELEENEFQVQVTPRYQPSTTRQHVITSETEEINRQHRPQYPVHINHGKTIEQNQSSIYTTHSRRPNQRIYPSFNSNTTTFENGDSYITSESHIPMTYVIELTVKEYDERLHRLTDELVRLGYGRLTEEEYNATIASGGFMHNGYKYLYNADSGRYEKTSRMEVSDKDYKVIYNKLQNKLREIGLGDMCDQEVTQAIDTGVFIRNGNKFVYNLGRDEYEGIKITEPERREIFGRIQELLRRLGYRLLTQRENEGVLINGHFIRAAHQWIYNYVDGTVEKTIFVGDFAEFTDDEYREIYQKIQDTLKRIGYAQMSEGQCNATITSGTFERGGIYWSYNPMNGEFERILLNQDEFRERLQILKNELRRLRHNELSEEEYREIINQGYFDHDGNRYEYVKHMKRYERIEMSAAEYRERLRQLQEQLLRIGYGTMSTAEYNSTITSGRFNYGGNEWVYNSDTRNYEIEMSAAEYRERLRQLQEQLLRIGYGTMSAAEYNSTIASGRFNYDGNVWVYNSYTRIYEIENKEMSAAEYRERLRQLQEQLIRIGYGTMSTAEYNSTITTGRFNYGGNVWVYNSYERIYEIDNSEMSAAEYRERLRQLQEQLIRIGYGTMSTAEYNSTITTGRFNYGGNVWVYNSYKRIYEIENIEMSAAEYRERLRQLQEQLLRIGYGTMSTAECNSTITSGRFNYDGNVWVYNSYKRIYEIENIEMSAAEYRERLRQLQEQLIRIGYGTMSTAECNSTITSGRFNYGGNVWVYNSYKRIYEIGNKSNQGNPQERPHHGIISKNRGDQPPQHFEEDYESDEILEEEPGPIGYYPIGVKPEVGLATPKTFETTLIPTTAKPRYVVPSNYNSQRESQRNEQQLTTQMWPAQPQTVSERRFQRKQTTYTQTTGLLPQQTPTQRSMRHIPSDELEGRTTPLEAEPTEELSTPFEPTAISTEAYLVGNTRPYNSNDQSGIIERYLRNERHRSPVVETTLPENYQSQDDVQMVERLRSPVVETTSPENYQRQDDVQMVERYRSPVVETTLPENYQRQYDVQMSENIDMGQQYEDFNGQHEEDVQQHLIDMNEEAEDLRQQQVDITQSDDGNQQKLLDNYVQTSVSNHQNGYNSHYNGQKESAHEYEAEVIEVTDKADSQNEDSPGLWKRLKNKTKWILG